MRKHVSTTQRPYAQLPAVLLSNLYRYPPGEHTRRADPPHRQPAPTSQLITTLIGGGLIMLVWHAVVTIVGYPSWLFPGPLDVLARLRQAWIDETLQQHTLPTLIESLGGFGLALIVGTLVGYCTAHSRRLERWIAPYLAAVQAIPIIAVAPLIIIWFGYSSDILRNMVVAAIVVFFPIFSSTFTSVRNIPRELREVGLVEGANLWQRVRYIEFPLALPVLFSGLRTSLAYATTGAVVGEFIGSRYGLGALINLARGFFDTPLIFVALFCLGIITLFFYLLLVALERLLLAWQG
jgi:NitT/TauT family transport system permease protein